MVVWLFMLFNVERFHEPINIASFVYVYITAIVGLLVFVRQIHKISPYLLSALLIFPFILYKLMRGIEVVGSHLPLTITEVSAIIVTVLISRKIMQSIAEFERAATDAILMQNDTQLSPFDMGQGRLSRDSPGPPVQPAAGPGRPVADRTEHQKLVESFYAGSAAESG
jgi:hypothetical protein